MLVLAFLIGWLFMILLRIIVAPIVWIMIIGFFVMLIAIGYYCLNCAENKYPYEAATEEDPEVNPENKNTYYGLLITGYVMFGLAVIYLIFILCS